MAVANAYQRADINSFRDCIEKIILNISDFFNIRVVWNTDTAILLGAFSLAGGLVGGIAGGRMFAALGAGIGGATGLGVSMFVSLREIWSCIKAKLEELYFIVFNYLRRLDPEHIITAVQLLMTCRSTKTEIANALLDLLKEKLGRNVISSLTAA
ncbi:unnamed protein product [Leptidea sinapis]|uniref:Uncharacterized protein n=1 Tax=Leptidea sinapis TaxID=189913 RepID=A0A5E4QQL7_9NEOP|nr:unnamed protein product [Leptidea sinapis]